ncbi:MAG TPA: hypothetical protein VGG98_00350 [Solirubrobacteraceae bacterium]|jgi:hypothetical protein
MTMHKAPSRDSGGSHDRAARPLAVLSAVLLGVAAALLVSCGSGGKGLIPTGNAGPLQSDFEAVAQAARSGDGSCASTAAAIRKTEQDFAALPASIDAGLRNTLRQGISNLRTRALVLCAQPLPQATVTSPSTSATQPTTTVTTPVETQTTDTQTTPATTPTTTTPGGGTPAPGAGGGEGPSGAGGQGGGTGAGEGAGNNGASGGAGSGSAGAGSGEGGK